MKKPDSDTIRLFFIYAVVGFIFVLLLFLSVLTEQSKRIAIQEEYTEILRTQVNQKCWWRNDKKSNKIPQA